MLATARSTCSSFRDVLLRRPTALGAIGMARALRRSLLRAQAGPENRGDITMATIETNDVASVAAEEILEQLTPMVRARPAAVTEEGTAFGMGWLRDLPDFRDYTPENAEVKSQLKAIGAADAEPASLPATVDLRQYCSPIENQLSLGSCTANAAAGLVEYFERRAHGNFLDASRLFIYKATRDLLHWTGDTGAYLRSTIGALALFGVPPEEYWPYKVTSFDIEPSAFCYAFAHDYRAISYFRLDDGTTTPSTLLTKIKVGLSAGLPCVFGFTVYSSIAQAAKTGRIPYPAAGEKVLGGHAMLVVGYDDNMTIPNTNNGGT